MVKLPKYIIELKFHYDEIEVTTHVNDKALEKLCNLIFHEIDTRDVPALYFGIRSPVISFIDEESEKRVKTLINIVKNIASKLNAHCERKREENLMRLTTDDDSAFLKIILSLVTVFYEILNLSSKDLENLVDEICEADFCNEVKLLEERQLLRGKTLTYVKSVKEFVKLLTDEAYAMEALKKIGYMVSLHDYGSSKWVTIDVGQILSKKRALTFGKSGETLYTVIVKKDIPPAFEEVYSEFFKWLREVMESRSLYSSIENTEEGVQYNYLLDGIEGLKVCYITELLNSIEDRFPEKVFHVLGKLVKAYGEKLKIGKLNDDIFEDLFYGFTPSMMAIKTVKTFMTNTQKLFKHFTTINIERK